MFRLILALCAIIPAAFSQNLPSILWSQPLDTSGTDSFAGLATDAQGNVYIAGSTLSPNFPVKSAVQPQLMTGGAYRITGPGSAYARVGTGLAISRVFVDPKNANVLYGISNGSGIGSVDGGNMWTPLAIPSTLVQSFAVDPLNDRNVYAVASDIGVVESTNRGATWATINTGQTGAQYVWVDPNFEGVVFVSNQTALARSADGGSTWQTVGPTSYDAIEVDFDSTNPGVAYAFASSGAFRSTDDGLTFQSVSIPAGSLVADPHQPGRLLGNGVGRVYQSLDDGATWAPVSFPGGAILAADLANGFLYGSYPSSSNTGIVRVSSDLQTTTPVGPPGANPYGLAAAGGILYDFLSGGHNAFVTKLDPNGNVVYSTYYGGTGDDVASAMAVDPSGGAYVTGTTTSQDFPTTQNAYSSSPANTFLFKLNPDGSVAYSTYFASLQSNTGAGPRIAVDATGSAYLTGMDSQGLPVTQGAYQTVCGCSGFMPPILGPFIPPPYDGFVTKFDPTGSKLVYSTYLGFSASTAGLYVLALAPDNSVYVTGPGGFIRLNSTGSSLLASSAPVVDGSSAHAMAVAPDGSVYLAGAVATNQFQTTPTAFEPISPAAPFLPAQGACCAAAIAKMDPLLQNVIAATYFGGVYGEQDEALLLDASGNVYIAGYTAPRGLPTRTEFFEAFGALGFTGFLSELSGDLSTLLFSTYLGDSEYFGIQSIATGANGAIVVGGSTGGNSTGAPMNVWINTIAVAPPPALRVDSVVNAASLLGGAISVGETILINGAGFGTDAQVSIESTPVPLISIAPTQIIALVPSNLTNSAVNVEVQSGGAASNVVFVPVAAASPGLFSVDGSGIGQGYILNQNGTRNTPANPAAPGEKITIYATGVGALSISDGFAVTASPVSVYIDGFYCNGVAAVIGPVPGFPGNVYQLTVIVPNPASLAASNPNLQNFVFPPQVGVILQIAGASSQNGLSISIGG
jgi:uncharacterized protein (TIGR03437 family)